MTRRRKPKSPEQIAAEKRAKQRAARMLDLTAVEMQAEAADLSAHADVEVTRAGETRQSYKRGSKVEADSARRLDAFEALRESMSSEAFTGAYDAARRLEHDMTLRAGCGDKGRGLDRVDGSTAANPIWAIVEAGKRVDEVLAKLPARDAWLLTEIIAPSPAVLAGRAARRKAFEERVEAMERPYQARLAEHRTDTPEGRKARHAIVAEMRAKLSEMQKDHQATSTWRDIVAHITGETNPNAQGAAVRAACVNLRDAYAQIDGQPNRRAA